jgi:hypothetical protein
VTPTKKPAAKYEDDLAFEEKKIEPSSYTYGSGVSQKPA